MTHGGAGRRLTAMIFLILKSINLNPYETTYIFHKKAVTSEIDTLGTAALHASNPSVKTLFLKWVFESSTLCILSFVSDRLLVAADI